MHTRGVTKRLAKDQETEEGRGKEEEITAVEEVETILTTAEPTPVSYTHLDVYKRQR